MTNQTVANNYGMISDQPLEFFAKPFPLYNKVIRNKVSRPLVAAAAD